MRNKRLDVLRCIAVLTIVIYHSLAVWSPTFMDWGWVGVDLFFVLSGFLISGLLYSEYKKRGNISFGRFFVRRGFKIYPAFYVLLIVTFCADLVLGTHRTLGAYLREIFFVQNYAYGIWAHTWSLAVEEHFYIFLPLLFLFLTRFSVNRDNPFRMVPWIFAFIATACLAARAASIYLTSPAVFRYQMIMNPTHLRIDALFFGVFLGYLHHFRPELLETSLRSHSNQLAIGALTILFLSCCVVFSRDSHFLLIFGLSFLYLGFGGLLMLSLHVNNVLPTRLAALMSKVGTACAFVGMYSYSIYLWHPAVGSWAPGVIRRVLHIQFSGWMLYAFFIWGGVAFGILMGKIIELPVTRIRDRLFPAPNKRVMVPPSDLKQNPVPSVPV